MTNRGGTVGPGGSLTPAAGARWTIGRQLIAALTEHAAEERPRECCGLLLGVAAGDSARGGVITEARRATNLSDDPHRFLLDPSAHLAVLRECRGRGVQLVGFYHSHPHSPASPSPTDVAECLYPDLLQVIVSPPEVRGFYIGAGGFEEVTLETAPESGD